MTKSNQARSRDHQACRRFNFFSVIKYSRILWSIQISHWCSAPSMKSSTPRMLDHRQHFLVMDFVVAFHGGEQFGKGCHFPSSEDCWDRTALVAKSELLASMRDDLELSRSTRIGVEVTFPLSTSKASCSLEPHFHLVLALVKSQRGRAW